jgi:hypothetical protein
MLGFIRNIIELHPRREDKVTHSRLINNEQPANSTLSNSHSQIDGVIKQIRAIEKTPGSSRDKLILRVIESQSDDVITSATDAYKLISLISDQAKRYAALNYVIKNRGEDIIKGGADACRLVKLIDYESNRAQIVPLILRLEAIGDANGVHSICTLLGYESNRFNTLLDVISRRGSTVIKSADDACKLVRLIDYESNRVSGHSTPSFLPLPQVCDNPQSSI